VGFAATLVSFVLACGFCALTVQSAFVRRCERALAPLLATPHVAVAVGFAFLIAPSGWIARLISPELTGWDRPPALVTVRDPYGFSFAVGLVLKEVPYLVLMMLAASGQVAVRPLLAAARGMGYSATTAWAKVVLPLIYRQIRLPLYAVLAFSLSTVEVGLILAPGNPPPLSVLALRWYQAPDLALTFRRLQPRCCSSSSSRQRSSYGTGAERLAWVLGRPWIRGGARRGTVVPVLAGAGGLAIAAGTLSLPVARRPRALGLHGRVALSRRPSNPLVPGALEPPQRLNSAPRQHPPDRHRGRSDRCCSGARLP
jgi:putative thiamine transport system permease protein